MFTALGKASRCPAARSATTRPAIYQHLRRHVHGWRRRVLQWVQAVTLTNVSVTGNDATASAADIAFASGGGIDHSVGQSFEMSGGALSDNTASATSTSEQRERPGRRRVLHGGRDCHADERHGRRQRCARRRHGTGSDRPGRRHQHRSAEASRCPAARSATTPPVPPPRPRDRTGRRCEASSVLTVTLNDVAVDGNAATASGPGDIVIAQGGGLAAFSGKRRGGRQFDQRQQRERDRHVGFDRRDRRTAAGCPGR